MTNQEQILELKRENARLQAHNVELASRLNIINLGPTALDAAANWCASLHKERDLL